MLVPSLAMADDFWVEPPPLPHEKVQAQSLYAADQDTDPHRPVRINARPSELAALFLALDQKLPPIRTHSFNADEDEEQNYTEIPSTFLPGSAEDLIIRFIRRFEAGAKGYDSVWYGNRHPLPARPTEMTVCQVRDWQLAARERQASTAIGLFQIVGGTFRNVIEKMGLTCELKFDAATQDRIGLALLYGRGWAGFKSGKMSVEDFGYELAGEWAAFPAPYGDDKGRSRYWRIANNRHQIELSEYMEFLRDLRGKISAGSAISTEEQVPIVDVASAEVSDRRALDAPMTTPGLRIRSFSR